MTPNDAAECALACFHDAWSDSIEDYNNRKIISEASLQAAQYHHLRSILEQKDERFSIYANCKVEFVRGTLNFFDTLILYNKVVVLAVEYKYRPNGAPSKKEVIADLEKLSALNRWSSNMEPLKLLFGRYRSGPKEMKLEATVTPHRRLVIAAFVHAEKFPNDNATFWHKYGDGCNAKGWGSRANMPPYLSIVLAQAMADGTAGVRPFGGIRAIPRT